MTTKTIVKRKADDFKTGMTVDEVRKFLMDVHNVTDGARGGYLDSTVRCTVNMRGGIKELSVEVTTDD